MKKIIKLFKLLLTTNDKSILIYASSLSFYTILNIVPLLSLSFFIFANLPNYKEQSTQISTFLIKLILPDEEHANITYLQEFLANSNKLDVFGIIAMIFALLVFFNSYENIISKISNSKKRSFFACLSIYWSLITLAPLALLASFFLSYKIQNYLDVLNISFNFLSFLPFLIIWFMFFLSFHISINKQITIKVSLIVSLATSFIWYIFKNAFIIYITYNKVYASLYGSFAALLFFFIWVYFSWIIYLNGIKVCSIFS